MGSLTTLLSGSCVENVRGTWAPSAVPAGPGGFEKKAFPGKGPGGPGGFDKKAIGPSSGAPNAASTQERLEQIIREIGELRRALKKQ